MTTRADVGGNLACDAAGAVKLGAEITNEVLQALFGDDADEMQPALGHEHDGLMDMAD